VGDFPAQAQVAAWAPGGLRVRLGRGPFLDAGPKDCSVWAERKKKKVVVLLLGSLGCRASYAQRGPCERPGQNWPNCTVNTILFFFFQK